MKYMIFGLHPDGGARERIVENETIAERIAMVWEDLGFSVSWSEVEDE